MTDITALTKQALTDIPMYAEGNGITLREYQRQVANAIYKSVFSGKGLTFVIIFPRQSGKNELQAQIEGYLLTMFSQTDAEIVKVSPTWKPQSMNAMRRLERVLKRHVVSRHLWEKEQGYIFRLENSRIYFLSAAPTANIVGATASLLLECDEAQDVTIEKWDKEINPMAASTNATRIFWGTAWTSTTLLAREKRAALKAQEQDGIQRVFELNADIVGQEVPAYKKFVRAEVAKLGRNHPFIKTQFYSEEIDAQGGMFPLERQALMQGTHPPQAKPETGRAGASQPLYAFTIDVAGQDEAASLDPTVALGGPGAGEGGSRDSTALTIFEIDLSTLDDPIIYAPTYRVIHRKLWTGIKHTSLYAQLRELVEAWNPLHIVIDATGLGEVMYSFLAKAYPGKVIPFKFTAASKSQLGWDFLAIIETGRYKESTCTLSTIAQTTQAELQRLFWSQCTHCQLDIIPGPGRVMRWSVPEGTRDPATGDLVHDDLLISAALCAELDGLTWGTAESAVIPALDPINDSHF